MAIKPMTAIFMKGVSNDAELNEETKELLHAFFKREVRPILTRQGPALLAQSLACEQMRVLCQFFASPLSESIMSKTECVSTKILEKRCEYFKSNRTKLQAALLNFIAEKFSDMHEIIDRLFIGNLKAAGHKGNHTAKQTLQHHRIRHILCICSERHLPFPGDFTYHFIVLPDKAEANLSQHFEKTFELIEKALSAKEGILVHCSKGMSRSPAIVIAYLMRKYRYPYKKALYLVRSRRTIAQPNQGFKQQLRQYESMVMVPKYADSDNEKI